MEQAADFDYVIANGDYSCNTPFVGVSDDAACQSVVECIGKLRHRFGARLRVNYGDHELGKLPMFGASGGLRLASWRRAREEVGLDPFWRLEIGRYVLIGFVSSLVALPSCGDDMLPDERPEWERLRDEHLAEIRRAFDALAARPARPALLPRSDRSPLPLARGERPRQTPPGRADHHRPLAHQPPLLEKPPAGGHAARALPRSHGGAPEQRLEPGPLLAPFNVRLCPALAGVELLKDGGYCTLELDPEARQPSRFRFHRLYWS